MKYTTPIVSIIDQVHAVAEHLRDFYEREKYSIQFKNDESAAGFETAKPSVYELSVLSSEMRNGYPTKCPCAVITISQIDGDGVAQCAIEMCVVDPTISPSEIAKKVEDSPGFYTLGDEAIQSTTQNNLIRESVRFMELTLRALRNCKTVDITDITAEAPEPNTPYYPYSTSIIYFSTALNRCKIGENPLNNLF